MPAPILVVEDDPVLADYLAECLRQLGYTPALAYDGEAALEQMRAQPPALVLMDLVMPDMGGWELARLMRGDRRLQNVPILICTGLRPARVPNNLVQGILLKPFSVEELAAQVRAALAAAKD